MRLGQGGSTTERVRDAAIEVFGQQGFGASLRTVAAAADLTAGRVVQLFGSKEKLREACDDHVFGVIRETKHGAVVGPGGPATMLAQLAAFEKYIPYVAYVARSVQAGGASARAFIDHMVEDALGYIGDAVAAGTVVPSRDERARVRYLAESSMGHLALRLSLDAPQDASEVAVSLRRYVDDIVLPALELFTGGLLADRSMLEEYLLYVGDPPGQDQAATA